MDRLQKLRSELTERTFAHLYETGGMRRVHLQGRKNILKRLLVYSSEAHSDLVAQCSRDREAQVPPSILTRTVHFLCLHVVPCRSYFSSASRDPLG